MSDKKHSLGSIEVSPAAIASIANAAVLTCYGVVGTAHKDLATGIVSLLSPDSKRGIEVHVNDGQVAIDIYVIVENNVNVREVSRNTQKEVARAISEMVGMEVGRVNIHIENIQYPTELKAEA